MSARRQCAADAPLRVLHVIPGEPDGVSMIFAKRQIEALARTGVAGDIFFLRSRTTLGGVCRETWRLLRTIRLWRPDLVHAHFGTVTALICAVVTRRPLVITFRGSDLNPAPSMSAVRSLTGRLFSQIAALRAARVICVSKEVRSRLWWRRSGAIVVPSGVDLRMFRPSDRDSARRELNWPVDTPVVLFNAGTTHAVKRLDLAESAVAFARELYGPVTLHILKGAVPPEDMPTYLNAADCVLMTSDYEGSPNIVKEALACNTPVVSVPVGDVSERLEGVAMSAVVERDPRALGSAVAEVLRSGQRSDGRRYVEGLGIEEVAFRIAVVYRQALQLPAKVATAGAPMEKPTAR